MDCYIPFSVIVYTFTLIIRESNFCKFSFLIILIGCYIPLFILIWGQQISCIISKAFRLTCVLTFYISEILIMYMYFCVSVLIYNKGFTFLTFILISYYSSVGKLLYLYSVFTVIQVFQHIDSPWIFYLFQKFIFIVIAVCKFSLNIYSSKLISFITVLCFSSGMIFYLP